MEISREDLQRQYEKLSDSELLEIYNRRTDYTDLAVEVLTAEIKLRNLRPEQEAENVFTEAEEEIQPEDPTGLRFVEKLVSYLGSPVLLVVLIFLSFFVEASFRETYGRKVSEAFFFVLWSLGMMVILAIMDNTGLLNWHKEFWVIGFLLPFLISIRPRTTKQPIETVEDLSEEASGSSDVERL
jgi:hypothetical protein